MKKDGKKCVFSWDEIEKLTVVTMEMKARSAYYTGQKIIIIAQKKYVGTVNSIDIRNFNKLIYYLTAAKITFPDKIFTPRQFQEKILLTYFYAVALWFILIMMTGSIFLSIDSKHYIFHK